jgi:uncharacterized protein YjbI with pentapeptide repeats
MHSNLSETFRFGMPDLASLPFEDRRIQAVKLLKAGKIERFNRAVAKARKTDPAFTLDLSGADLSHLNLTGADFKGALLKNTNLSAARLANADLLEADLRGAKLQGTNLIKASLCRADLTGVDLSGATLQSRSPEDYESLRLYGGADLGLNCRVQTSPDYTWSAPT